MKRVPRPVRWLVGIAVLVFLGFQLSNARKGYHPKQPIPFNHARMAGAPNWVTEDGKQVNKGGFGIPCLYCHNMPYKGRHSTLPSTNICMNCHNTVGQDREWVRRMKEDYWEKGKPIPWVKVHDLPDYVFFDHSAHLNAVDAQGQPKVVCQDCHGKVEEMVEVSVQTNFNMGWCIQCHRKPEMAAPTDCVTCHR